MTNFDFLQSEPQFAGFSEAAIGAERLYAVDSAACAIGCRRAMEFAVKWMYSVDAALILPYSDNLFSLMNAEEFLALLDNDLVGFAADNVYVTFDADSSMKLIERVYVPWQ